MYHNGNSFTASRFPASCAYRTTPKAQIAPDFATDTSRGDPGCYIVRVSYTKCSFWGVK